MQQLASINGSTWAQQDAQNAAAQALATFNDETAAYNNAVSAAAANKQGAVDDIQDKDATGIAESAGYLQYQLDAAQLLLDGEMWIIQNTPWAISIIAPTLLIVERAASLVRISNLGGIEDIPDWFDSLNGAYRYGSQGDPNVRELGLRWHDVRR